jgi:prepilin signal peptidase PulO-like enzyme (type II secretory pathway)
MLTIIYATLFGLIIGSAINAIVWRLYVGRSWAKGRSMCPDCEHALAAKDLIPVASWLWLRGKCRYCGKKIHWQYPAVELLTAILFGLSAYVMAPSTVIANLLLVLWLGILTTLIILAVYDLRWMILPDKVVYPAIGLGIIYMLVNAFSVHNWMAVRGPLAAAFLVTGVFYGIAAFSGGRAMGGGDVKLVFLMGLLLGLKGTALAMLIAFNTAAIIGIALIVTHKKRRRDHIPFGPFLVGATVITFLYGQSVIDWYMITNGL